MPIQPPAATAVLLIDTFNDFLAEGGKLWPRLKEQAERVGLLGNLRRLVGVSRALGLPVFFVPHRRYHEGDYADWKFTNLTHDKTAEYRIFEHGSWGAAFHDEVAPLEGDVVVTEHWTHSGFANTDLDFQLRARGIERLVVAGMRTNACFEATARYAVELGYHVTLLSDATAAFSQAEMDSTLLYSAPYYAHAICTTEEFVCSLETGA